MTPTPTRSAVISLPSLSTLVTSSFTLDTNPGFDLENVFVALVPNIGSYYTELYSKKGVPTGVIGDTGSISG